MNKLSSNFGDNPKINRIEGPKPFIAVFFLDIKSACNKRETILKIN